MSSIPESVSFVSPTKASRSRRQQSVASKDDNSTIKTEDQGANRMDVDDDDDESSWYSNLRDSESEEGETPEMEALRKQVAELTSIVSGLAQTKSFDSSEGSKSNLAGNLKKKTKQGNASSSSIAGDSKASRRSTLEKRNARLEVVVELELVEMSMQRRPSEMRPICCGGHPSVFLVVQVANGWVCQCC
ncbi:hypothetical protein SEMRO_960_G224880.1 [Seminavis robusta]|uniref:Uncharacterized protein n=1 Tax=Seminavis robusta TaxID=568900 RepID=A0A9N8HQ76_9STRA|nr:hypothetical protein SEMRO_960_G224880.1 [Seminavis robusta]|eukprot:Sro960_g224880.1 n/a (189) ;mRNA; f:27127-27693